MFGEAELNFVKFKISECKVKPGDKIEAIAFANSCPRLDGVFFAPSVRDELKVYDSEGDVPLQPSRIVCGCLDLGAVKTFSTGCEIYDGVGLSSANLFELNNLK